MHTAIRTITIAALAIMLSGCGKGGLSVGSGLSANAQAGSKKSLDGSTTLSTGKTPKTSTAVPGV
jgi:hypothetical protein